MNIKPLPNLTRLLVILLKVDTGFLIVAVVADAYGYLEYSSLSSEVNANDTLLKSDIVNIVVGLAQLALAVILAITFLRWIYRANKNLHVLSSERMTFSPGWSVGWYFIPIANLFRPYQAMKEIWSVAHRGAVGGRSLLGWWWGLWIVSHFLGRLALKLGLRAENARGYALSAAADVFSDALDIALNIVAVFLVTAIARAYASNYVGQPAAANGGPDAGDGKGVCAECGESFSRENMIAVGTHIVCAKCKPIFIQKISEGAKLRS